MKTITEKQKNYILKLNPNAEGLENLSIKEASFMIRELLKQSNGETPKKSTQEAKEQANKNIKELVEAIDFDALRKKYNAYYKTRQNGIYKNDKGANCKSDLLYDSRKFKKYISDILKKEFPFLKFSINCSLARSYSKKIKVVLVGAREKIFKSYKEIFTNKKDSYCSFYNNYYGAYRKMKNSFYFDFCGDDYLSALYLENYYMKSEIHPSSDIVKDEIMKVLAFINDLLLSFSYDNSDSMTDYFDYGIQQEIKIKAVEGFKDWKEQNEVQNSFSHCENVEDIKKLFAPLSDSIVKELEEAEKENAIIFEEYRKQYEEKKENI